MSLKFDKTIMKTLLFAMTLTYSVSGYSAFVMPQHEIDLMNEATALLKKSTRASNLGDLYSGCKFMRQANDKIYEIKTELPENVKKALINMNNIAAKECKNY